MRWAWALLSAYAFELGLGGALALWVIFSGTAFMFSASRRVSYLPLRGSQIKSTADRLQ